MGEKLNGECLPIQQIGSLEQDIAEINILQNAFNTATGVQIVGKDLRNRSYNPVIDRWHVEKLFEDPEKLGKLDDYLAEIRRNIHTNLQERMFAVETQSKFLIKDGKLYSELFPTESFGQVILRGANWRAWHGSQEKEREGMQGELAGWMKINDTLAGGKVGTKIVSLSPQGRIRDTSYDGRYFDIFEKVEEEGAEFVKRTRIAVDFDDDGYKQTALILDPTFFDNQDDRPLDAWYLSHPIVVTGLPTKDLPLPKTAMGQEEFEAIYEKLKTTKLIDYYLQVIQRQPIDWKEVAKAFNTILTVADNFKEGKGIGDIATEVRERAVRRGSFIITQEIPDRLIGAAALVGLLGTKRVRQVGGGGCPPNRGIDLVDPFVDPIERMGNSAMVQELFGNGVGQFGFNSQKETWTYEDGNCVVCHEDGEVGPCGICKDCEKKF